MKHSVVLFTYFRRTIFYLSYDVFGAPFERLYILLKFIPVLLFTLLNNFIIQFDIFHLFRWKMSIKYNIYGERLCLYLLKANALLNFKYINILSLVSCIFNCQDSQILSYESISSLFSFFNKFLCCRFFLIQSCFTEGC